MTRANHLGAELLAGNAQRLAGGETSAASDGPPIVDTSRCWICSSTRWQPYQNRGIDRALTPDDVKITDSAYGVTLALRRCSDCGFVFADEQDVAELVHLYEQLEDSAYEATQDSRALQMRWLLKRGRQLHPAARTMLDVGAGAGLLVAEARRAGLDAVGVEPSHWLVDAARRLYGLELCQGVYPHPALEGRQFDLIYLVDVIEHVSNPRQLLEACGKALAPGGVLLVITPDLGSATARLLGRRWWHLRLAHIGYFNERSLAEAVRRCSLEVIDRCRPTWYFRLRYVAQRLVRYLPVGGINRLAERVGILRRLYDTVVPVNPRDSLFVALRRAS